MGEGSDEDVVIHLGDLDAIRKAVEQNGASSRYLEREAFIFRKGIGSILVRDGREIVVDILSAASEDFIHPLILNAGIGIILHQRGMLPLHASAVSVAGEAIVFLGTPGSGKSTTAAALYHKGYQLLSDEVVAIRMEDDKAWVFAACPILRLMPDAVQSFGDDYKSLPKVHPADEKRIQKARRDFSPGPYPLRRIYIMGQDPENKICPIEPQEAFVELIRHSYTVGLLKTSGASTHLIQCAKLIEDVPVKRLNRSGDLTQLPQIVKMIEEDLI